MNAAITAPTPITTYRPGPAEVHARMRGFPKLGFGWGERETDRCIFQNSANSWCDRESVGYRYVLGT